MIIIKKDGRSFRLILVRQINYTNLVTLGNVQHHCKLLKTGFLRAYSQVRLFIGSI